MEVDDLTVNRINNMTVGTILPSNKLEGAMEDAEEGSVDIPDVTQIKEYVEEYGGKIDEIKVNGVTQPIVDKTVDIEIPEDVVHKDENDLALVAGLKDGINEILVEDLVALKGRGKYLTTWDAETGLPETEPVSGIPYTYHTGDYFIVGTVSTGTNYKPDGTSYTGDASDVEETEDIKVNDTYLFDGENWKLLSIPIPTATWGTIQGTLSSQTDLQNALDAKADDDSVVKLTGDQTIAGSKTFSSSIIAHSIGTTSTDPGALGLNVNGSSRFQATTSAFSPTSSDGGLNLGTATRRYNNLYLKNNIVDGTNSISVAQMVNKQDKVPYVSLERLGDYLYQVTFDTVPEYTPLSTFDATGCTSFVRDGKLYRNLDWNYDGAVEFKVVFKGAEGMSFISSITNDNLDPELIGQLPYHMNDGRNTAGLMVSTHVLYNDFDYEGSGTKTVPITKLPYLVLTTMDSVGTLSTEVQDAITNMQLPTALGEYLIQVLVTDGTTTKVLTPTSSGYEYVDITALPKLANFKWLNKATLQRNDADLQDRPTGIERWNAIDEDVTLEDLKFTEAYTSTNRLSEFIGINDTDKDSTDAELLAIQQIAAGKYATRTRDGETWQTVHSVIYGAGGMESLHTQEDYDKEYIAQGGGGTWGSITGTLSDQTDLQAALDSKMDDGDVKAVSGDSGNNNYLHKIKINGTTYDLPQFVKPAYNPERYGIGIGHGAFTRGYGITIGRNSGANYGGQQFLTIGAWSNIARATINLGHNNKNSIPETFCFDSIGGSQGSGLTIDKANLTMLVHDTDHIFFRNEDLKNATTLSSYTNGKTLTDYLDAKADVEDIHITGEDYTLEV